MLLGTATPPLTTNRERSAINGYQTTTTIIRIASTGRPARLRILPRVDRPERDSGISLNEQQRKIEARCLENGWHLERVDSMPAKACVCVARTARRQSCAGPAWLGRASIACSLSYGHPGETGVRDADQT